MTDHIGGSVFSRLNQKNWLWSHGMVTDGAGVICWLMKFEYLALLLFY